MNRHFWLLMSLVLSLWLPLESMDRAAGETSLLAPAASATPSPTAIPVAVLSPVAGQAVQGIVPVMVNTYVEGFLSAELYFSYMGDETGTWFLIEQQSMAMAGTAFATWDTTTITDGNYVLRLVVTARDRPPIIHLVESLRVRNYSPVETDTPTPSPTPQPGDIPTQTPTPEPTVTPVPLTPTPLPTNPAILSSGQFGNSAGLGVLAVIAAFLLLGGYVALRQGLRRRD